MSILLIILGILLILCGVSCIFTPILTFMQTGIILMILLLVYGIAGIVKAVAQKEYGLNFAFSILSVILGIIIMVVPGMDILTDGVLIYMMACWFILQGIVSIALSVKFRGINGGKKWIWGIVFGAVGILLGIYSVFHPLLLAFTTGILIGVYFVVSGINMIVISSALDN